MNRVLSIPRRRPHLVDMTLPKTFGVDSYRIKWAQNFDGSFATIFTSPKTGFLDDSIDRGKVESQPMSDTVRMVFDPTTYSINDALSFWVQAFTVTGGTETAVSGLTLILPDAAHHGVGIVTIQGLAPNVGSSAAALQLDLPRLMQDFQIYNQDSANPLLVSTEAGGPEFTLKSGTFPQYTPRLGTQGSIWVRGPGVIVPFSASFTAAFPR